MYQALEALRSKHTVYWCVSYDSQDVVLRVAQEKAAGSTNGFCRDPRTANVVLRNTGILVLLLMKNVSYHLEGCAEYGEALAEIQQLRDSSAGWPLFPSASPYPHVPRGVVMSTL